MVLAALRWHVILRWARRPDRGDGGLHRSPFTPFKGTAKGPLLWARLAVMLTGGAVLRLLERNTSALPALAPPAAGPQFTLYERFFLEAPRGRGVSSLGHSFRRCPPAPGFWRLKNDATCPSDRGGMRRRQ